MQTNQQPDISNKEIIDHEKQWLELKIEKVGLLSEATQYFDKNGSICQDCIDKLTNINNKMQIVLLNGQIKAHKEHIKRYSEHKNQKL